MRAEDSQMMNILYAPVMYIHSDNLSSFHSNQDILSDALLNHWIIKQYHLENIPDCWQPNDTISMLLFPNWHMIPKTADFIGGYLLRERLLIERSCLITNPQLLAFVSLPLRHTINIGVEINDVNYSAYGAAFILGLSKIWPLALQQRLRLFFPQDMHFPKIHIPTTPDHINLLRMAINYARDSHM